LLDGFRLREARFFMSAYLESMSNRTTHPSITGDSLPYVHAEETPQLLQRLCPLCAACREVLASHTYRFFSCHPTASGDNFLATAQAGDWASVHGMQTPSVDQPRFVVYAIACPPSSQTGGMVAMLRCDIDGSAALDLQQAFSPEDFAALRALCPTCQWIAFTPALQSGQENV
jgi:hypothetical protein